MSVLGAFIGILVAAGVALVLYGATTPAPGPHREQVTSRPPSLTGRRLRQARARLSRREQLTVSIAAAAGLLIALTSGWLMAILLLPLLAWGLPRMLFWRKDSTIATLEALEEWTRRLSSLFVAGHHLGETLAASLRSCPEPIRPQVELLVARLQARQRPTDALYTFADELDDETGDMVALTLIRGATAFGGSLGRILDDLADMTANEVTKRRAVITAQAAPRGEARMVTIIGAVMALWILLGSSYGGFYFTPLGQSVLAIFIGVFVAMAWWINSIASPVKPPRFLIRPRDTRSA